MTTTAVVTSPRTGVKLAAVPTNRNTEWLNQKAAWAFYVILILLSWLVIASWTDPGLAWTYVHLGHGAITYYLLHWNKGSPIQDDQGIYDRCGQQAQGLGGHPCRLCRRQRRTAFKCLLEPPAALPSGARSKQHAMPASAGCRWYCSLLAANTGSLATLCTGQPGRKSATWLRWPLLVAHASIFRHIDRESKCCTENILHLCSLPHATA